MAILTDKGFSIDIRNPSSLLEITSFDEQPFGRLIERVEGKDIRIRSLQSLFQLSDWQEKYWRLNEEILQDVPAPEPYRKRPLTLFVQQKVESPQFAPDCIHIALIGSSWVGMSELWLDPEHPELGSTGLTGVSREWRRMGIATTLKVSVIRVARERGAQTHDHIQRRKQRYAGNQSCIGFQAPPSVARLVADSRLIELTVQTESFSYFFMSSGLDGYLLHSGTPYRWTVLALSQNLTDDFLHTCKNVVYYL